MKLNTLKLNTGAFILFAGVMASCGDPNSPGLEYMPDMYRSPAVEAYVDYAEVRGLFRKELVGDKVSLTPPAGTIPYYGTGENVTVMMPYQHGAPIGSDKTHGLYGMKLDSAGYAKSAFDKNPIPYSEEVVKEGEKLYGIFCIHCHGKTGDGQGTVVLNGGFPQPPAYNGQLKDLPAGTIFYSVTYGKGMMGSHASQLNKEERWKVVHYVEKLQGKQQGAAATTDSTAAPIVAEADAAHEGHDHP